MHHTLASLLNLKKERFEKVYANRSGSYCATQKTPSGNANELEGEGTHWMRSRIASL